MNNFAFGVATTIAVVSVAGNVLMYQRYSTHRPLFEVNNQVIRQKDLDDRLNYLYSNNVLRNMIVDDLINQEATKEGVVPSQTDIDAAKQQIERSRPTVLSEARATDPTLELFDQELKAKLELRNLEIKSVTVTPAEVQDYYNQHKANYMLPTQVQSTVVLAKDPVAADTAAQMLKSNINPKVIAGTPDLAVVGINAGAAPSLSKDDLAQVLAMKSGEIKSFNLGSMYMVVEAKTASAQGIPPLSQIYQQVETDTKLAKATPEQQEIAKLVQDAHITVESDKYAAAVPSVSSSHSGS